MPVESELFRKKCFVSYFTGYKHRRQHQEWAPHFVDGHKQHNIIKILTVVSHELKK